MSTPHELIELIATEAAGELSADQARRLDSLCTADESSRLFRERFASLIATGATDDTTDAPGQSLHRAYQIMRQELESSHTAPVKSLLQIVFDSLKPAPGLRSASTARRQLLLETDSVSVDLFVDNVPAGCAVTVMLEGVSEAEVVLVGDSGEIIMKQDNDGWYATVKPCTVKLEIRLPGRTLTSEPFQIA